MGGGAFVSLFLEDECIDPVGESLCNFDIVTTIAEKLGLKEEYTLGKTHEEKQKLAFEASGVEELISWEELQKKKYYVIPCDPEVKDAPPGLGRFCEDPEEQSSDDPYGSPRVLLLRSREAFPRRSRAAPRGRMGREGREPRRAPLQRTD